MEQTSTSLNIYNQNGESIAEVKLNLKWLNFAPNSYAVRHYAVNYLKNQRHWSASTKTRAEVAGSRKKPWRQKGTGRARTGSLISPIFRGGGIIFGPQPKDIRGRMPKKVKRLAFDSVLYQRIKEGGVRIIDNIKLESPRTKTIVELLGRLDVVGKALVVLDKNDENLQLSVRNLPQVTCRRVDNLNAYDLVAHPTLIFNRESVKRLELIEQSAEDQLPR